MIRTPFVPSRRLYRLVAHRPRATIGGFSLVEVLVAVLVLSVGLLGLAALQVTGLRASDSARMRTEASMAAYDLADRLRADPAAFFAMGQGSKGKQSIAANACGVTPTASGAVGRWVRYVCDMRLRPPTSGDRASIDCQDSNPCGAGNCEILFRWNDERGEAPAASGSGVRAPGTVEFRYCTRLATAV